jgi:hypothetical protein
VLLKRRRERRIHQREPGRPSHRIGDVSLAIFTGMPSSPAMVARWCSDRTPGACPSHSNTQDQTMSIPGSLLIHLKTDLFMAKLRHAGTRCVQSKRGMPTARFIAYRLLRKSCRQRYPVLSFYG